MWSVIPAGVDADRLAASGDVVLLGSRTSGEIHALNPATPAAPRLVGTGWHGIEAVVSSPDASSLFVVDGNGLLWQTAGAAPVPGAASLVARDCGSVRQLAAPADNAVYILDRPLRGVIGMPGLSRPGPRQAGSRPMPERYRLRRVDLDTGDVRPLVTGLRDAGGLVVRADESAALVSVVGDGTVIEVDLQNGTRTPVVSGLDRPRHVAWLDEARNLVLVAEETGLAVVDVTARSVRSVGGVAGSVRTLVRAGDLVVLRADQLVSVGAHTLEPDRLVLSMAPGPVPVGGYARVEVSLGSSGLRLEDLTFEVAEGPEHAIVSQRTDAGADPARPHVMLLAGPHPGVYTLQVSDMGGAMLAEAPFEVTNEWREDDGPSMAFTGAHRLYAGGGAWGSQLNGGWPFEFTFGVDAVSGDRRVALIFCHTQDATLPAGTQAAFRNALSVGVAQADGVARSVAAYFQEVSDDRLRIVPAGEATVTLPEAWSAYTKPFTQMPDKFESTHRLPADAMSQAQAMIDFTQVDTAVFVVASPNGGAPLPTPPGGDPGPARFCWPIAWSGTYQLEQPRRGPFPWWWKSLPWVSMPAEWESLDPRRIFDTLTHEIGHTIGLPDLYGDAREVSGYELMVTSSGLPTHCLPVQAALGWVDPADLATYNFRYQNPVDDEVILTATELLGVGGPPAGERAGALIEVTDGQRYFFEYRSRQNAGDGGAATQVGDQAMPSDRRVVGTDVVAGWYSPPITRKPVRLLGDDGDGEGAVLTLQQDYQEIDAGGNAVFRLSVLQADDARATVRVQYGPPPSPEPPWPTGPDPSIRPWPGGDNWQSPDIRVVHALNATNMPWAGHVNTIEADVSNAGVVAATGVRVGFWVKDFTLAAHGPETFLGWAPPADVPAGGTATFSMTWVPPAQPGFLGGPLGFAHYCVVVRIAPHAQGNPPRGEVSYDNNEAQSNYTILWTVAGSPFDRARVPVTVTNPYPDRAVDVHLQAEQTLEHFRTYLSATSLRLAPGETRTAEVMVECIADEPLFADTVPTDVLYGTPNVISAIALVQDGDGDVPVPVGGATIEVRAGRRTQFTGLDVSAANTLGTVELTDGTPVTDGEVVVATQPSGTIPELVARTRVGTDGRFALDTPDVQAVVAAGSSVALDVLYLGAGQFAPVSATVVVG